MLRRGDGHVLRTQVEKTQESNSVGLEREDALNQVRWRVGVGEIAVRVEYLNLATPVYRDKSGSKLEMVMMSRFKLLHNPLLKQSVWINQDVHS